MPTLLHILVSANMESSLSRKMSSEFVQQWQEKHADGSIETLDLAKTPTPVVDSDYLRATRGDDASLTEDQRKIKVESGALVDQFVRADVIVIGTPIYNLSIPAGLKAYIDKVVVAGKTFQYTANGPKGLLSNKEAFILFAGGTAPNMVCSNPSLNFYQAYMVAIMKYMGIENVTTMYSSGRTQEAIEQAINELKPQIAAVL